MNVVALGQQKGGVGKSAAAINLACQAAAERLNVALIDMDTEQGTARKWAMRREGALPVVKVIAADSVSLPGALAGLRASGVDWVFLDLPGRNAPISSAGLVAADLIIIPCRPLDVDIEASGATVQAAIRAKRPYAYLMNIAPAQGDRQRARMVARVLTEAGQPVVPVIIVQRLDVPDGISSGRGVNEMKKPGESAAEFKELFAWIKGKLK